MTLDLFIHVNNLLKNSVSGTLSSVQGLIPHSQYDVKNILGWLWSS